MLAPEGNATLPSAHPAHLSLPAALQLGEQGSWLSRNIYTLRGQSSFYMLCVWGFKKKAMGLRLERILDAIVSPPLFSE